MTAMIRVGVAGCGYWGINHVRVLSELGSCQLVAACDPRPEARKMLQARYPGLVLYEDFELFLEHPHLDAVVLATPVLTHSPLGRRVLEAGKHLLVEKPLAHSTAEAMGLAGLAAQKKRVLLAGHTYLYNPAVHKIAELLRSRDLGELYYIDSSRVNLGLFQDDTNVIWDLGPHDVSIVLFWMEKDPLAVSAWGGAYVEKGKHDAAFIKMEFESGILAHVHVSWLAPTKLRRTVVVGSQKMILFDDSDPSEKVKIYDRGVVRDQSPGSFYEHHLTYRYGSVTIPPIDPAEPLRLEAMDFLQSIEEGSAPRSDGQMGIRVVRVLEAANRSLAERRWIRLSEVASSASGG